MTNDQSRRAVFFDRDGTLMDEVNYCRDPALVRAIPGAAEGLAALRAAGWLSIVITNQSGLGRGWITPEEYRAVEDELLRQLGGLIDATYFCPDTPDAPSDRRKPGVGMVLEAAWDWGIDPRRSYFVGDKAADIECGRAAGTRTILVLTGYGGQHRNAGADVIVPDVAAAVRAIMAGG
jgi:D-glycero-D-manno-heptose 1,7-bisphosphate phosphatase